MCGEKSKIQLQYWDTKKERQEGVPEVVTFTTKNKINTFVRNSSSLTTPEVGTVLEMQLNGGGGGSPAGAKLHPHPSHTFFFTQPPPLPKEVRGVCELILHPLDLLDCHRRLVFLAIGVCGGEIFLLVV